MQRTLNELTTTLLLSFCTQTGFSGCLQRRLAPSCHVSPIEQQGEHRNQRTQNEKKRNAIKSENKFFVIQFKTQQKTHRQKFLLPAISARIPMTEEYIYESLLMKKDSFLFTFHHRQRVKQASIRTSMSE